MNREAELEAALQEAWAELERKQRYMQDAVDTANRLQAELDLLKQAAADQAQHGPDNGDGPLQAALNEAWVELEKKQQFLENSFEEIRLRDEEIASLRQQLVDEAHTKGQSQSLLQPDVQAAMQKAWDELEDRDRQIAALTGQLEAQAARLDWLILENKTLSSAIGVDKMRQ